MKQRDLKVLKVFVILLEKNEVYHTDLRILENSDVLKCNNEFPKFKFSYAYDCTLISFSSKLCLVRKTLA